MEGNTEVELMGDRLLEALSFLETAVKTMTTKDTNEKVLRLYYNFGFVIFGFPCILSL
jgi:hypothetical protein